MAWPPDQAFPHFCCITTALDQIDVERLTNDQKTLFVTLEGLINRTQPRIYIKDAVRENYNLWPQQMHLTLHPVLDPYSMILKYRSQIAGMIVDDPRMPATLNLATTIAGLKNALVASPTEAQKLQAAPYHLAILTDLRQNNFTSASAVYQYAYNTYWTQSEHHMIAGLSTQTFGTLRDYAVATRSMVIWLDPRNPLQKSILDAFFKDMEAGSAYMGWWADERSGVREASRYGIGTFASDLSSNLTVMGATPQTINIQSKRPIQPTLENKTYVAMFLSDGDNVQLNQHLIATKWADPKRGKVPIGWTMSPALVDLAPAILNYYRSTATPDDELVSGPSGMGYAYPDLMPAPALSIYTALTKEYLQRAGFDIITVWGTQPCMPIPVGEAYRSPAPYPPLGITTQQATGTDHSGSRLYDHALISLSLDAAYANSKREMELAIVNTMRSDQANSGPHFIAIQGNINNSTINPSALYSIQQLFKTNPNIVFVGPEELFMLAHTTSVVSFVTQPLCA
jgi:hypothetical protein